MLNLYRFWKYKIKIDYSNLNLKDPYLKEVGLTRVLKPCPWGWGCGRWFQKGGYSFQQLPKELRKKILINDNEVEELDYSASHPHLLYSWEKQQAPNDFYLRVINQLKKMGFPSATKEMVKKIFLVSINAKSESELKQVLYKDRLDEISANVYRQNLGLLPRLIVLDEMKKMMLKPKTILKAYKSVHPLIRKYFFTNQSNKLMFEESEILTDVLLELMKLEIPALPIHDSLLFPKQYKDKVKQVMLDCYHNHTGFKIEVK
jgi:hypothetical protein